MAEQPEFFEKTAQANTSAASSSAGPAEPAEPSEERATSRPRRQANRAEIERRLSRRAFAVAALAGLVAYGFFVDGSIRDDPFDATPDTIDWLTNNQPHPALAAMPVVPIGARGTLTYRPADTAWINSPYPPFEAPAAAAGLSLVGSAHAEMAKQRLAQSSNEAAPVQQQQQPPQVQQTAPVGQQQQQQQQQIESPLMNEAPAQQAIAEADRLENRYLPAGDTSGRARIVHAQCLPAKVDSQRKQTPGPCWISVENDPDLHRNDWDGKGWQPVLPAGGVGPIQFFEFGSATNEGYGVTKSSPIDFVKLTGDGTQAAPAATLEVPVVDTKATLPMATYPGSAPLPAARFLPLKDYGVLLGNDSSAPTSEPSLVRRALEVAALTPGMGRDGEFTEGWVSLVGSNGSSPHFKVVFAGDTGRLYVVDLPENVDIGELLKSPPDLNYADTGTVANLRSIYFQDDRIGWVASGWNDGNEEGARPAVLQTTDGGATWERLSYRHYPAPWVLYGALPGLLIAFVGAAVAARQIAAAGEPARGIEDIGASDQPIGWNDTDVLGLKPLARAVSRFLRNRNTDPPLTIAVCGQWGSGKSSLMNLISEDLAASGTRPVWFNAWHHQKEEHLLAALLTNIRSQAVPAFWRGSGVGFRFRLFLRRAGKRTLGFAVFLFAVVIAWLALYYIVPDEQIARAQGWIAWTKASFLDAFTNPAGFDATAFLQGIFGAGTIGATIVLVLKVLMQLGAFSLDPAKLMASLSEKTKVKDYSDQLSFRYRFADEFGDVCHALRSGPNAGLVIMIDDLDRCRADNVMEVLEAVNFLASAGPCFIFLGIDKDKVVDAVAKQFDGNADYARRYMEKLVNIEITIPAGTAEATADLSVDDERPDASPWPARIRALLRLVPDAMIPALGVMVALVLIVTLPLRPPPSRETAPVEVAAEAQTAQGDTGAGAADNNAPPPSGGRETPIVEVALPTVAADALGPRSLWPTAIVLVFVLGGIALSLLRRSTVAEAQPVEDSADFREALRIWHPVIFAANPTPRGIKRHQNRLRFQAMRLRPLKAPADWLDRLFGGKGETNDATQTDTTTGIDDPLLVAIGALDAYDETHRTRPIKGKGAPPSTFTSIAKSQDVPDVVEKSIHAHREAFPADWPPTGDQVRAYRGLATEVRH